jgi:hypothetical protein
MDRHDPDLETVMAQACRDRHDPDLETAVTQTGDSHDPDL